MIQCSNDTNIVCICNQVDELRIRATIITQKVKTIEELQKHLSICNFCTGCTWALEQILEQENELLG